MIERFAIRLIIAVSRHYAVTKFPNDPWLDIFNTAIAIRYNQSSYKGKQKGSFADRFGNLLGEQVAELNESARHQEESEEILGSRA